MTRKRNDEHSTEFGLWLREQASIDSKLGFVATNVDFLWTNYKSDLWMLIEEKRFNRPVRYAQQQMFKVLDAACSSDRNYRGLHILIFEKTSPEDGKIQLDGEIISKDELLSFLRFDRL
jgi:hypothetical protein